MCGYFNLSFCFPLKAKVTLLVELWGLREFSIWRLSDSAYNLLHVNPDRCVRNEADSFFANRLIRRLITDYAHTCHVTELLMLQEWISEW